MTPAEFAWALVAGHGRALQYIKEHGDSRPEIRAALMNACTSCLSIDPQVDPRWRWVAEMILHTASPDDYLSEIHRQAPVLNERDNRHCGQILFEFVRRGHPEALAWIAPKVVELGIEYDWLQYKGFRGILDIIHQAEGPDDCRVMCYYDESCSMASELEVRELLETSDSPKVRAFLEQLDAPPEVESEGTPLRFDVREIFPEATNQRLAPRFRSATDVDLERVLQWLESTDSTFRFMVMNTWSNCGPPLHRDSEFLRRLARDAESFRDRRVACHLLGTLPSQSVIELGEYYLGEGDFDLATHLLKQSWKAEYSTALQTRARHVIPETGEEFHAHHDLAFSGVELMKETKHPSLVPLAEWVIHFNPCCICREGAIEFLAGVGSLTPELATESQYDAVKFD